jgi:hypothetical protein
VTHVHEYGGHEYLSHVPDSAPAVFAARADITFDPPARGDRIETAVLRFVAALSVGLADAGCTLVGHTKGTLTADAGDLVFHVTLLDVAPEVTGGFSGRVDEAQLTVNVIVFGVDEGSLPAIVRHAWSRASGAATTWRG